MKRVLRYLFWTSFFIYCFALLNILFIRSRGHWGNISLIEYMKYSSNFIPFKTIWGYIQALLRGTMNVNIPIKNIFGNLLLFLPMGLYLPCMAKRLRTPGRFAISTFILPVIIETLQLLLRRGCFDIDDLIMNSLGSLIGYGIWRVKYVQKLLNISGINSK